MIKLSPHGFIEKASWPKVTPKSLKNWWVYLYWNFLYKTRKILSFNNDNVIYMDDVWARYNSPWYCSAQHFCRVCPTEATPEEIDFLNESYLK
mgnify:CR=1 FL=1